MSEGVEGGLRAVEGGGGEERRGEEKREEQPRARPEAAAVMKIS